MTNAGDDVGDALRETARRTSSLAGALRMLSGNFRARVTSALDAAARLEDGRRAHERDRAELRQALTRYHELLSSSRDRMEVLADRTTETLRECGTTQERVLQVQERALDLEQRAKALDEEDRRLTVVGEELAQAQHACSQLLERLQGDLSLATTEVTEAREVHSSAAACWEEIRTLLQELESRQRDLVEREGSVSSREEAHARAAEELATARAAVSAQSDQLGSVLDALRDEGARLSQSAVDLVERSTAAEALQQDLAETLAGVQARERDLDARQADIESRSGELHECKLAQDRERVELDARIQQLSNLEDRDAQLLRVKEHLDEQKRRLDAADQQVRGQQLRTLETWDQLKDTLQRLEVIEERVQDTHEDARRTRDDTAAAARTREAELVERRRRLDELQKQLDVWRMETQLRERRVQERFNELEELEARKERVRDEVAQLEREQAERIAAFERSREEQQRIWAERRAEAEKARELYERNGHLLERRIGEVAAREEEHAQRARDLQVKTLEIERRERRLRAAEARVRELEEQRQSLNATIASLTARASISAPGGVAADLADG